MPTRPRLSLDGLVGCAQAMPMRRVVILGCSGAGKSTFARKLGAKIGAPVVYLDALFWRPGWVEPTAEEFRAQVAAAVTSDAWVTDGNYVSRSFDLRLPRADAVIYLDQPRWRCLVRVFWRWIFTSPASHHNAPFAPHSAHRASRCGLGKQRISQSGFLRQRERLPAASNKAE